MKTITPRLLPFAAACLAAPAFAQASAAELGDRYTADSRRAELRGSHAPSYRSLGSESSKAARRESSKEFEALRVFSIGQEMAQSTSAYLNVVSLAAAPAMNEGKEASDGAGTDSNEMEDIRRARRVLEEIVVTAQKREERLQDVPISISVLRGEELDRSTGQGVTEALNRVSGVTANEVGGGVTNVRIRGIGALGVGHTGTAPSAYYLDSVPLGLVRSAFLPDANAYDLDRVEVLRGPQGTLYGASALNGVVRVLTSDASPDELEFKARGSTSSTQGGGSNYRGDAAVNIPIVSGKLAARAVVGYQDLGGWIDKPNQNKKDANEGEVRNLRLKVNAQPIENLSIGLSAWLSRTDYDAFALLSDEDGRNFSVVDEPQSVDYDTYSIKIEYEFSSMSVSSMTGYLNYNNEFTEDRRVPNSTIPIFVGIPADAFSQEVIFNSTHGGPWRWTVGGLYRDADERLITKVVSILDSDNNFHSRAYAIFGELTRLLFDEKVELTAGLRYFEDEVTMTETRGAAASLLPPVTEEFDNVSPRVVLNWHPRQDLTVYASYSEGFRSGFPQGPNSLRAATAAGLNIGGVSEDSLKNYELGAKGSLLEGRISVDTALYYMDWTGVQQGISLPRPGGGFIAVILNGESASGMGFDFGVTSQPIKGLEFGLNFSWNDLSMDGNVLSAGTLLFAKGDRLNYSSEYTAGLSADYIFPLGGGGYEGRFSTSASYTSEQEVRTVVSGVRRTLAGDSPLIVRSSFSIHAPKNWVATIFADNLNNEQSSITPGTRAVLGTGVEHMRPRPRTIGVQLEYRY